MYIICLSIHSYSFQIDTLADSNSTCNMFYMNVWSLLVASMHLTKLFEKQIFSKAVLKIFYEYIKQTYDWIFLNVRVLFTRFSLSPDFQQSGFIYHSLIVVGCRDFWANIPTFLFPIFIEILLVMNFIMHGHDRVHETGKIDYWIIDFQFFINDRKLASLKGLSLSFFYFM